MINPGSSDGRLPSSSTPVIPSIPITGIDSQPSRISSMASTIRQASTHHQLNSLHTLSMLLFLPPGSAVSSSQSFSNRCRICCYGNGLHNLLHKLSVPAQHFLRRSRRDYIYFPIASFDGSFVSLIDAESVYDELVSTGFTRADEVTEKHLRQGNPVLLFYTMKI